MYSRKIKQMKKKLLSSSNNSVSNSSKTSSYGGNSNSNNINNSSTNNGGGGSSGGGLNPNWGPRIALIEREQQQQRLREYREQKEYLKQQQQEFNNNNKKKQYKNPYATSGIGIHTSNGFICKTNKKLLLMEEEEEDQAGRLDKEVYKRRSSKPLTRSTAVSSTPAIVTGTGNGDFNTRSRSEYVRKGFLTHMNSPPLTIGTNNDSLASTKTYHSSGGSSYGGHSSISSEGSIGHDDGGDYGCGVESGVGGVVSGRISRHSFSSTNSSTPSSIGRRSSLILGSDHNDEDEYDINEASGSYNMMMGINGSIGVGVGQRTTGLIPFELHKTDANDENDVRLININQIYEERRGFGAGGGGFYNENIAVGANRDKNLGVKSKPIGNYAKELNMHPEQDWNRKGPSKLLQRFSMVYVPMESTKKAPVESNYSRRQLKPPEEILEVTNALPLPLPPKQSSMRQAVPENETGETDKPPNRNRSQASCCTNSEDVDSLLESFDSILFNPKLKSGSSAESTAAEKLGVQNGHEQGQLQHQLQSKPPLPASNVQASSSIDYSGNVIFRKKTPPPLPPKNKPKSNKALPPLPSGSGSAIPTAAFDCDSLAPPSNLKPKSLRFSDQLDIKSPSPYSTSMSFEANNHNNLVSMADTNNEGQESTEEASEWQRQQQKNVPFAFSQMYSKGQSQYHHQSRSSIEEDNGPTSMTNTTGPVSRTSIYSGCTTSTMLSCGHVKDSYSTLSSINSDQISDNGVDDVAGELKISAAAAGASCSSTTGENQQKQQPSKVSPKEIKGTLLKNLLNQEEEYNIDDVTSSKSALQQLRDLSILIGGSFHTSPGISGATVEENPKSKGNIKSPQTAAATDESKILRKCSTDDSGKGSGTGSGRSRSGCSTSADSMPHILNLGLNSNNNVGYLRKQKQQMQHNHHQNKRTTNDSAGNNNITTNNTNNGNASTSSTCSCDSSLSSCLFTPECEECQKVFRNPFEILPNLPELQYIEANSSKNTKTQQKSSAEQQQSSSISTKKSSKSSINSSINGSSSSSTSRKEVTRKNSVKLSTKKKFYPSFAKAAANNNKNNEIKPSSSSQKPNIDNTKVSNLINRTGLGAMNLNDTSSSSSSAAAAIAATAAGCCTKTQLLLTKSVNGCLGCYNEQLIAQQSANNNNNNLNVSNHHSINPLFTIDEAAEENDGTLKQQQQQLHKHSHHASHSAASLSQGHNHNNQQLQISNKGNKLKRSKSKAKYSRKHKKPSSTSKKRHNNGHSKHGQVSQVSSLAQNHHVHPKCWLETDGTMGWSDLESIYSQNLKTLEETGPSSSSSSGFLNGECITCWKELMQYKQNASDSNYTVERTKRMFIWLNRRPKEFNEPWWEAKKQASIKWIVTKAYNHLPKGSVQNPFKESTKKDSNKVCLKEQVMAGLATGKLYCMALENLFKDCTVEERQSIFGPQLNYNKQQHHHQQSSSNNNGQQYNNNSANLTHWEIIKILSRKGIYVAQPSDMKLTEGTLRQRKPFRITAHIALIEAIMGLYAKVILTQQRIEPVVNNLGFILEPDTTTPEDFVLAWINAVIDTLKSYILSTSSRKLVPSTSAIPTDDDNNNNANHDHHYQRWLNILPLTDLRELYDGIGLCSLFVLYFSNEFTLDQVNINEPNEPLDIYDSIRNHTMLQNLFSILFPHETIYHLKLTDLLYIHGYMKQNILQLLLDMFYYTEILPMSHVSRLTHVPLRIQL